MNRIQQVQARASARLQTPEAERPTIPAPAYAACRAAALRAQVAHELLVEARRAELSTRETWPAPSATDWDVQP